MGVPWWAGSGGMPPQKTFKKLGALRLNLRAFSTMFLDINIVQNSIKFIFGG